jgi:hypothetical protein
MRLIAMRYLKVVWLALATSAILLIPSVQAKADSVTSYDVSTTFSNGQQLSGVVSWDSTTGSASSYTLSLTGTSKSDSCSSSGWTSCTNVWDAYTGTGTYSNDSEWLTGYLTPTSPQFTLTVWGWGWGNYNSYCSNLTWTPVAMPEPSSMIELLVAGAFLAFGISKARTAKAAIQG